MHQFRKKKCENSIEIDGKKMKIAKNIFNDDIASKDNDNVVKFLHFGKHQNINEL